MRSRWAYLLAFFFPLIGAAQHPQLLRYVPGSYLTDNVHRVEFQNPSNKSLPLAGYLLVTRDYSMIFPAGISIPPRSKFVVAKLPSKDVDFHLVGTPNFLVRFHYLEHQGHYIALFSPAGQLLDAAYMSPSQSVPFLPDRDTLVALSGSRVPFSLPPENRPDWKYVPIQPSRSMGYLKEAGGWRAEDKVVVEPVEFGGLTLRFEAGIVTLKWSTHRERGCRKFIVERSQDLQTFVPVGEEASKGAVGENMYSFYEGGLSDGETYYYRVKAEDGLGKHYLSGIAKMSAVEVKEDFVMEVLSGMAGELRVRIDSRFAQQVRLKLFNESFQEVAILFQDYVYADAPALVVVNADLSPGHRYMVMATTEHGRFVKEFVVAR